MPAARQGAFVQPAADDERHPLAAHERRQMARRAGRAGTLVDGRPDLHPLVEAGVWERLLVLAQQRGVQLGMTFLDGTSVRAHHKAAGAGPKTALRRAEAQVKRLAALVAAMAPRPA